jgi:protein TIF31
VAKALECAEEAWKVIKLRLGDEHGQSVECGKGVELLRGVVNRGLGGFVAPGQLANGGQPNPQGQIQGQGQGQIPSSNPTQPANLTSTSARLAQLRSRLSPSSIAGSSTGAGTKVQIEVDPKIGERGHLDVDELVKFIQGGAGSGTGGQGVKRGKKGVRGKKGK